MDSILGTKNASGDDQARLIYDTVHDFAIKNMPRARVRALRSVVPGFDMELWTSIAEQGWIGLFVPESLGGLGLGPIETACVVDALAEHVAPEPYVSVGIFSASLLQNSADVELARKELERLITGQSLPVVAWQNDRTGNLDPFDGSARILSSDDSGFLVAGTKYHVRPGAGATSLIVTARFDDGTPAIVLLPCETPGIEVFSVPMADGTFEGRVNFPRVSVSDGQILARGEAAQRAFAYAYDVAMVMTAVELLALVRNMVSMTLEYLCTRRQFDRPIGSFQALQHRAVDLWIQRSLTEAVVAEALKALAEGVPPSVRSRLAARAKARASDAALHVAREAVQMHGAIGFTDEYDLSLYVQRALVLSAWLGNAAQQRRRYAALDNELVPTGER